MRWIDLYNGGYGEYISDIYDISSDFDSYLDTLSFNYTNNEGTIDIEVRFSYDSTTWQDWIKINDVSYIPFFEDEDIDLSNLRFQYKVILNNTGGGSKAVFNYLKFDLVGVIRIINIGDLVCKPEIWIRKTVGDGDIKITNETLGTTMEFTDIFNGEEIYIDCENEDIISDRELTYRIDNHNGVFLELDTGENLISGEGDFELDIRYEFKTIQG